MARRSYYDNAYANLYPDVLESGGPSATTAAPRVRNQSASAAMPALRANPYASPYDEPSDEVSTTTPTEPQQPMPGAPTTPTEPTTPQTPRTFTLPRSVTQGFLNAVYAPSRYPGYGVQDNQLIWSGSGTRPTDAQMQAITDYLTALGTPLDTSNYQGFFERLYGHRTANAQTLADSGLSVILQAGGIQLGRPNAAGIIDSIILPDGTEVDVGYAFSGNNQPGQPSTRWVWNPITQRNEQTPTTPTPTPTTTPTDYSRGYGPLLEPYTTPFTYTRNPYIQMPNAPVYRAPALPTFEPFTYADFEAPIAEPFREFEAPADPGPFRDFSFDRPWTPTTQDDVLGDAEYQLAREEGLGALTNSAAARGFLRNTGTLQNFQQYASRLAGTRFDEIDARRRRDYDTEFGQAVDDYTLDRDTYYGNRDRTFDERLSDYLADRDTYFGLRDRTFDERLTDYRTDRDNAFQNYTTNITNLLALSDREQAQYAATYAPELLDWQERYARLTEAEREDYKRAWEKWIEDQRIFRTNQQNIWDRLSDQTDVGVRTA